MRGSSRDIRVGAGLFPLVPSHSRIINLFAGATVCRAPTVFHFTPVLRAGSYSRNQQGACNMFTPDRRFFLRSVTLGAGALATLQPSAATPDGHAAGYDVSPAHEFLRTSPRKSSYPVVCAASADRGP